MAQNSAADDDEASENQTAADVLDRIGSELADSVKVELSDDDMAALGVWTDGPSRDRIAEIWTPRDVDPVNCALYDVSDVDGYERGDYLALEIHDKQQGERYTRPYATGLGQIDATADMPDVDELADYINDETDARGVEPVGDDAIAQIAAELDRAAEEFITIAMEGNAWAAAFDGSTVYVEPEVSRWEGFEHVFDDIGLSEDQRRAVREAGGQWSRRPRHLDVNSAFSFAVDVRFE